MDERRRILRYTLRTNAYQARSWWYGKGPWFHIFALAGFVLVFELTLVWAFFPWLLDRVSVTV